MAIVANVFYGFPSKKLLVVGITGTNGKTTTTQMVAKILERSGKKVAMASTINFKIGEKEWVNTTKYTTLSPFTTQKFIAQAVQDGCEYLVLETSSHALDQYRVWGVQYVVAVITNVTREHLDYHKTMEQYRKAKLQLFEIVHKNKGVLVVNSQMEHAEEFILSKADTYVYSIGEAEKKANHVVTADAVSLKLDGSEFVIDGVPVALRIPGKFNIENALAAATVGITQGISLETIAQALGEITSIPGRMERVANKRGLQIIVDYAVTPDSLEKLYALVSEIRSGAERIIAVFGSCGERDRGKRPIMGEIVSRYADVVIVTNEDPYHEDPQQIIDEVAAGVKNKTMDEDFFTILDRREAIAKALSLAKTGDIVVVSGKGAEETMAIGSERLPWNDRKVIEEELTK